MITKRIIIAEQDDDIADVLKLILETNDYQASIVQTAPYLIAALYTQPDLLVLDPYLFRQAERSAWQTSKSDHLRFVPFLMLSCEVNIQNEAERYGATDYLAKPFDMQTLLEKVDRLTC